MFKGSSFPVPVDLRSRAYVIAVAVVGLAVLVASVSYAAPFRDWPGLLTFAALCAIAQIVPVALSRSSSVSVSAGITFAGIILFGPWAGIWVNLGSAVVAAFRPKLKPGHKIAFNAGNHVLAAAVAGAVYSAAGGTARPDRLDMAIAPIVLAAISYFAVQTLLISGIIALTERVSFLKTWDANFRRSGLNFVAMSIVSLSVAAADISIGTAGIIIFSIPLVMAWYVFRYIQDQSMAQASPGSEASR